MKKEQKDQVLAAVSADIQKYPHFYLVDIAGLNAGQTSTLRRECFNQGIKLTVVKNTFLELIFKGMENEEVMNLVPALKGNTAIMFCENPNAPAKLIKDFNKKGLEKPALKAAFVQECAYVGADKLDTLIAVKSREELIADIVALLQSPARNVISALQNAGSTIAGIVKTISEKEEK